MPRRNGNAIHHDTHRERTTVLAKAKQQAAFNTYAGVIQLPAPISAEVLQDRLYTQGLDRVMAHENGQHRTPVRGCPYCG